MKKTSFVSKHNLWTEQQSDAAEKLLASLQENEITTVRVSYADQHGILRGKTLVADEFKTILRNGCRLTSTLLLKDTSHRTVFPVWQGGAGLNLDAMTGASDFIAVPAPETFQILPWAHKTGWVLCDAYFQDGQPVPFCTRSILKKTLSQLSDAGYQYLSGIELEFSVYNIEDAKLDHTDCTQPGTPPSVTPLAHGYNYLTENRYDEIEPVMELLRSTLSTLGLPLRSLESEFGPSQFELTFDPVLGIQGADQVVLIRNAIKQVCRRQGLHATFMCRPNFPNAASNGWHLHQSLVDSKSGDNAFVPAEGELLSAIGYQYLAGILENASAATIFTTPTINGYKRYRANSLAPNQIVWGKDNRGAMLRLIGGAGDQSVHLENRIGEPAANPYLYYASQIISGLDGIKQRLEAPEAVDTPYDETAKKIPSNLYKAVLALKESRMFREALGADFVDYYLTIKEAELNRFLSETVTDWEQQEYFEIF